MSSRKHIGKKRFAEVITFSLHNQNLLHFEIMAFLLKWFNITCNRSFGSIGRQTWKRCKFWINLRSIIKHNHWFFCSSYCQGTYHDVIDSHFNFENHKQFFKKNMELYENVTSDLDWRSEANTAQKNEVFH